jgi:hypothetical protein
MTDDLSPPPPPVPGRDAPAEADPSPEDSADPTESEGRRAGGRRGAWWRRRRTLVPVAGVLGVLLGIGLAGGEGGTVAALEGELAAAEADREQVADRAATDLAEREGELLSQLDSLEEQVAGAEAERDAAGEERHAAEQERDAAVERAEAELEEEREQVLADAQDRADEVVTDAEVQADEVVTDAQAQADELVADAQERVEDLDDREAELEARAEDLDVTEERVAATTFGNGIHVVGDDIEPGTYRNDGGSNCYWARLSGLSGSFDDLVANGLPDGPTTVEISAGDVGFESSGCSDWVRAD